MARASPADACLCARRVDARGGRRGRGDGRLAAPSRRRDRAPDPPDAAARQRSISASNVLLAGVAADRLQTRAGVDAAFRRVEIHDSAEAARIRPSYLAYVQASDQAFAGGTADQRQTVAQRLDRFESVIDTEIAREAHQTHVTNPRARLALIIAAAAAALLIALLIWQFEMQRRAGRIDRDNAEQARELMRLATSSLRWSRTSCARRSRRSWAISS